MPINISCLQHEERGRAHLPDLRDSRVDDFRSPLKGHSNSRFELNEVQLWVRKAGSPPLLVSTLQVSEPIALSDQPSIVGIIRRVGSHRNVAASEAKLTKFVLQRLAVHA